MSIQSFISIFSQPLFFSLQLYTESKQAIFDTELMFHKEMREDGNFDQYWQEKLNVANMKVINTNLFNLAVHFFIVFHLSN